MDMGSVAIVAIVALLIGIFIGFLVSKATAKSDKSGNLKNQMDSLQGRFDDYQKEVVNHFNKTNNIAQKLSQNYQEMQAHLEHSVEALVSDTELRTKLISEIKASDQKALDYSAEATETTLISSDVTAPVEVATYDGRPKDYAPKVPGEPGTLAEEFGVKRK